MKRPFTILSTVLLTAGIAAPFMGYAFAGVSCSFLSAFLLLGEAKKVTEKIHFWLYILANLSIGINLDTFHSGFPWFSMALFCIGTQSSMRMLLFTKIGYTGYSWFEPLMLVASIGLYVTANLITHVGWPGWAFPAFFVFFAAFSTMGGILTKKDFTKSKNMEYEVAPGTIAPDFTLPDQEGNEVKLSDLKGKRHLLLLFVRGDWCPSCHIMLRTYEKNRELFQQKNVMLLAIGPDPIGVNKQMVLSLGLDYKVLADTKQEVVRRFGIQMQEPAAYAKYETGIPMPASFLVDKSGTVRYTSRADRAGDFLNPSKIFDILPSLN